MHFILKLQKSLYPAFKTAKNRARYDLRQFFTNRIVNMWNSLPNEVVHAESTSTFKSRLDKFWSNQVGPGNHVLDGGAD